MTAKTVLIVDDHAPTREGYAALLREYGYRVIEAEHGGEAIVYAHQHSRIDAVLLDVLMPGLDGVEAAEWLRRFSPDTALIAITACQSQPELERMRKLCDDLLLKPCSPLSIISSIQSVLLASPRQRNH